MLVTTTMEVTGYEIVDYYGVVRGIIVRSPTIMQSFFGSLKNVVGGKIGAYSEMCEQARQQAYDAMIAHAQQLGANAIIAMRYDASQVGSDREGATEVLCYGTAVKLSKAKPAS